MKVESKLAGKLANGDFIVTAEILPGVSGNGSAIESAVKVLGKGLTAVNVADNCHGIGMSSIAASAAVLKAGFEPICQLVTRDRNRIALQSDLLGAAYLGIKNVMCLSGYHQVLTGCPESANVYDIDSIQFVELVTNMMEKRELANGTKIEGEFAMLVGAVANPFLKPMELNMLRLAKKVEAGAKFIQTGAIYDVEAFSQWFDAAKAEGITAKAAILAGVEPLNCAVEAQKLRETYTDYYIPDNVIDRLKKAGNEAVQKKEGIAICVETIKKLKQIKGLRGIHILSAAVPAAAKQLSPDVVAAALSLASA
ncbi:MAG: methylenetetrahydrofolate reductase [Sedimentisphaerales bacterium]